MSAPVGLTPRPAGLVLRSPRAGRWTGALSGRRHLVLALLLAALTLGVRLPRITTAYDVYFDEFFYAQMGQAVHDGGLPPVTDGDPFLLHPPGYFLYEGAWIGLLHLKFDWFATVYAMRQAEQLLAAVTVVAVYEVVRRLASTAAAVVAALLAVADPYVLRQNSRVLLETGTLMWVVVGLAVLVPLVLRHERDGDDGGRRVVVVAAVSGLASGLAVFSKDMAAPLVEVPLLVGLVTGWFLPRRATAAALAASAAPYAAYVAYLTSRGLLGQWWTDKTAGVARLLGAEISTGYNRADAPSAVTVALQQLATFGTSYALMGAGGLAALWLLWRPRHPADRVLGLCTTAGAALVGYGVLFGTNEEQLFYFVVIPALLTLGVAGDRLVRALLARRSAATTRTTAAVLAVLLAVTVVVDASSWWATRTADDDGQLHAVQWLRANAAPGSQVVGLEDQTGLMLQGDGLPVIRLESPARMRRQAPFYLLVQRKLVTEHYSYASPELVRYYTSRSDEVFSQRSETYGEVALYRVHDPATW